MKGGRRRPPSFGSFLSNGSLSPIVEHGSGSPRSDQINSLSATSPGGQFDDNNNILERARERISTVQQQVLQQQQQVVVLQQQQDNNSPLANRKRRDTNEHSYT